MSDDGQRARFFSWSADMRRERPARETLTRDQIVDAAVRILDTEGADALSMRRLGKELGAGATSVYWHVRNKDELLDLVVDRIIGEVVEELGDHHGWRAWMEAAATALRRVLLRHRGVAPIIGERPTFGPNALRTLERLVGELRAGGFEALDALLAATSVVNWASGFAVFEVRDPIGPNTSEEDRAAYTSELMAFIAALPADEFPTTIELVPVGATITSDQQFAYGLEVLLDGIELRQRRRAAAGEGSAGEGSAD